MSSQKNGRTLEILKQVLREIQPDPNQAYEFGWHRHEGGIRERLRLPYMVFATLLLGAACKYIHRPFEKTAWSIGLIYKGVRFRVEHGKFGISVYSPDLALSQAVLEGLLRALEKSFRLTDRILRPSVEEQIRQGNVTVANKFVALRGRYEFFRQQAEDAFTSERPKVELFSETGELQSSSWDAFKPEREGFYFASAAVDSYFSWIEHVLVLMLPFCGYDPSRDNLVTYIGSPWKEKFQRLFDIGCDRAAKRAYDLLILVKEKYRNSVAHGGFEKQGASLYVHMPLLGAVPARLSGYATSIQYDLYPINENSFAEVCHVLEQADTLFQTGAAKFGYRYAEAGMDSRFDARSVLEYRLSMQSEEAFEELIERTAYFESRNIDMDW